MYGCPCGKHRFSLPDGHRTISFARSLAGLARSVREVVILMADLDGDATPELSFTYQVSDEVVPEAVAVGRERLATRALQEALMAHTSAAVAPLAREGSSPHAAGAFW